MTGLGEELEEIKGGRYLRNKLFELTKHLLSSKQSTTRIPPVPQRAADGDGLSSGDNQPVKGVIDSLYN